MKNLCCGHSAVWYKSCTKQVNTLLLCPVVQQQFDSRVDTAVGFCNSLYDLVALQYFDNPLFL